MRGRVVVELGRLVLDEGDEVPAHPRRTLQGDLRVRLGVHAAGGEQRRGGDAVVLPDRLGVVLVEEVLQRLGGVGVQRVVGRGGDGLAGLRGQDRGDPDPVVLVRRPVIIPSVRKSPRRRLRSLVRAAGRRLRRWPGRSPATCSAVSRSSWSSAIARSGRSRRARRVRAGQRELGGLAGPRRPSRRPCRWPPCGPGSPRVPGLRRPAPARPRDPVLEVLGGLLVLGAAVGLSGPVLRLQLGEQPGLLQAVLPVLLQARRLRGPGRLLHRSRVLDGLGRGLGGLDRPPPRARWTCSRSRWPDPRT